MHQARRRCVIGGVVAWGLAALIAGGAASPAAGAEAAAALDLTEAVVVVAPDFARRRPSMVDLLLDEVEKRTGRQWTVSAEWPSEPGPVVAVGPADELEAFAGPLEPGANGLPTEAEGYRLTTGRAGNAPAALVVGADDRGVLFGMGRLLREMRMTRGMAQVADGLDIRTAPEYPLRGHQLGFRPKTNSYDAWAAAMWEQYIRELAVFGTNAIELIPPRSDDAPDSPHFPEPQIDMMEKMSKIADDYDLDVWIWYPALDEDYTDSATVAFALEEWGAVFARLPRVNAVLVPGGDPGHTPVRPLMSLLEKQAESLRRHHPEAGLWVSPQGFGREWTDEFVGILQDEQPPWLTGVVFAPQNFDSLADLRRAVPDRYPIRHYPDITHTVKCQFPVPDWDVAYAITEQREPINPRPVDYARIIRMYDEHTIGFLTYSEGCNDDVNKIVWSGLGWDPEADLGGILREYARFFIGPEYEHSFSRGLFALEENWRGPLLANGGVESTLALFRDLERAASPQTRLNWRFQQALYRAYYDAYVRRRLLYETELEAKAWDALRRAGLTASLTVLDEAERVLDRAVLERVGEDLRARVFELAEALYQSVRMQLSVPRYQAIDVGRGANLDLIDVPLNSRLWLKARFAEIREIEDERARLEAIEELVNRTNPGPGGYYDDLGDLTRQPHLVRDPEAFEAGREPHLRPWQDDPEFRRAALVGCQFDLTRSMAEITHAEARYDAPLIMHYDAVDPNAAYRVRVVYGGDAFRKGNRPVRVRLEAGEGLEVHPFIEKPYPLRAVEFAVPREATAEGELTLRFYAEPGIGGNGRACQVAEVWLIKSSE